MTKATGGPDELAQILSSAPHGHGRRRLLALVGAGLALLELDLALQAQLSPEMALAVIWGMAAPGPALVGEVPAQRLFVELRASTQGP